MTSLLEEIQQTLHQRAIKLRESATCKIDTPDEFREFFGDFELVDSTGWNASYEHWFNKHWLSNFTIARVSPDNNVGQPGATYDRAKYLAASLWWIPLPRMSLGIEYLWGQRQNLDGQDADANRLHGLFQYNF